MSKFNIQKDSLVRMSDNKVGMEVTFKADDGREVTQWHEIESADKAVIEQELQKAADEFEGREQTKAADPKLTVGKDISIELTK